MLPIGLNLVVCIMYFNSIYKTSVTAFRMNTPTLKIVANNTENRDGQQDRTHFEWLYDTYAPKAFGFITKHTKTKEEAEDMMMHVFLKVWENIKSFDKDIEQKFKRIVLMTCKPMYKNKYG